MAEAELLACAFAFVAVALGMGTDTAEGKQGIGTVALRCRAAIEPAHLQGIL